ncbi:hypothetical protein [Deinococcus sp. QL22]|uniref:hypothetical protein n=1 Tax=Deinococcus sp. QL22 TaxID=2939437 RepID=UPI002017FEAF|nr:hypothetical protein [Deinococcus sp. QL22]UQN09075.1 hypothetical protein M1R55_23795 [Deinococcus sp. QL22]
MATPRRALLPEGLHRSVGLRGGVPLDGMEKRLIKEGLSLFSLLRNLACSRGTLTAIETHLALENQVMGVVPVDQQTAQLHSALTHLASAAQLFSVTQDADGEAFRWQGCPYESHPFPPTYPRRDGQ